MMRVFEKISLMETQKVLSSFHSFQKMRFNLKSTGGSHCVARLLFAVIRLVPDLLAIYIYIYIQSVAIQLSMLTNSLAIVYISTLKKSEIENSETTGFYLYDENKYLSKVVQ